MQIADYIPVGQANAIPTKKLMQLTGLSQRHVCAAIEDARTDGAVILSKASGGYWLPDENNAEETRKELKRYIRFMDSRNTFQTTASARGMLKKLEPSNQMAFGSMRELGMYTGGKAKSSKWQSESHN